MKFYYLSKSSNSQGMVYVHADSCTKLPDILSRVYLGIFPNSLLAMDAAKDQFQVEKAAVCKCCI